MGRFTIANSEGFFDRFALPQGDWEPRSCYNFSPFQVIPVILLGDKASNCMLRMMHWRLILSWSKISSEGHHPINSRAETLAKHPMFRMLFRSHRCLIPASGFFEWKSTQKEKVPYYIHRKDKTFFEFAGLYDIWKGESSPVYSCIIITTGPNNVVAPIHYRMPAILLQEDEDTWLETKPLDPTTPHPIFTPYPDTLLETYCVSNLVNNPQNDSPDICAPLEKDYHEFLR